MVFPSSIRTLGYTLAYAISVLSHFILERPHLSYTDIITLNSNINTDTDTNTNTNNNSYEAHSFLSTMSFILGLQTEEALAKKILHDKSSSSSSPYKYPIISSSPKPEIGSDLYIYMKTMMDVIQVKDDRFYYIIHNEWNHFQYNFKVPNSRIEHEMTANVLYPTTTTISTNTNTDTETNTNTNNEKNNNNNKTTTVYESTYFTRINKDSFIEHHHHHHQQQQQEQQQPRYNRISSNPDLSCYRTVQGTYETMEYLSTNYPTLSELIPIGPSYLKSKNPNQGHEIQVLKITNKESSYSKKKAPYFILCGIHPRELATTEACTRFAEDLIIYHGYDSEKTWILDYIEIHMVLQANPDGREDEEQYYNFRRKNMNFGENGGGCNCFRGSTTAQGVDLNRNFPHRKWGSTNEGNECSETYAGTNAGSEMETQAIVNYIESVLPPGTNQMDYTGAYKDDSVGVLMDVHSFGQVIFWPYGYSNSAITRNEIDLRAMAKKITSFTSSPRFDSSNDVYTSSGDTTDYAYDAIGVAAYTLEIGTSFHLPCSDFETRTLGNTYWSLHYAARVANAPYVYPKGPDIISLEYTVSTTTGNDDDDDTKILSVQITASDNARANGYITGKQQLSAVKLYVDDHPYEDNVIPTMEMTSGFTSSEQTIVLNVPISGMSVGRHILFCQAYDIQGPGPVYSKYFTVT